MPGHHLNPIYEYLRKELHFRKKKDKKRLIHVGTDLKTELQPLRSQNEERQELIVTHVLVGWCCCDHSFFKCGVNKIYMIMYNMFWADWFICTCIKEPALNLNLQLCISNWVEIGPRQFNTVLNIVSRSFIMTPQGCRQLPWTFMTRKNNVCV